MCYNNSTMKILHFADVHVGMENYGILDAKTGISSRLMDFSKSLEFIATFVEKHKPDLILFAGDAYKDRHPSPTYQQIFTKPLIRMAKIAPVVMVIGNHDTPASMGKANTLDIFSTIEHPNIFISRVPEVLKIPIGKNRIEILTLPWISKSSFDLKNKIDYVNEIRNIINDKSYGLNPKFPAFFLGHASVEGAVLGSEQNVMLGSDIVVPLNALVEKKFQYVALGHLHKFQKLNANPPIVYSGSIEKIDFGEEKEDKGFVWYDTETKKLDFIKTPARPFKTFQISIGKGDSQEKILKKIRGQNFKEAIVKIIIQVDEEYANLISENEIRNEIKDAHLIASITKEIIKKGQLKETVNYSNYLTSLNASDTIKEFIKFKKINEKMSRLIQKYAKEIIEEE